MPHRSRELRAHLDLVLELSDTGSWEWDVAGGRISWSDQTYRIFGRLRRDFVPSCSSCLDCIHPEDRDYVERRVQRALDDQEAYDVEHRVMRPDGVVRVVRQRAEVMRDPWGLPQKMLGAMQDITALRAAEASAAQTQHMLAGMLKISPEAVVVADAGGRILLFSTGAEQIFGYRSDDILGRRIEMLIPNGARAQHRRLADRFMSGDASTLQMHERPEVMGQRRDGEPFPAEISVAKLETRAGLFVMAVVRDISAQKAHEAQLVEARERAEQANEAKSSFLANMSHEIRTPINGVLGVASVLARSELSPEQREMVALIQSSGRALQALLGDILDLAKIEAGKIVIRDEPLDPRLIAEDLVALFSAPAAEKNLQMTLEFVGGTTSELRGDSLRIRQIVSNFLSNAVKFTEAGQVALRVSLREEAETCWAVFSVADTGPGFSPAFGERLFGRFEQEDGSPTRAGAGTGLGLSISKSLVELMGGSIGAVSREGEGATFTAEIPLRRVALTAASPEALHTATGTAEADGRPLRVLLAEDHPTNQRLVQLILAEAPVDLTAVGNGEEAVAAAATGDFDLILMDLQMPVLDGLSAIRAIRETERTAGTPPVRICALTANASQDHQAAARAAGAEAFLAKPIEAEDLLALVMDSLDRIRRELQPAIVSLST